MKITKEKLEAIKDLRTNAVAVKGEEFGKHLKFFIELNSFSAIVQPDKAFIAALVVADLATRYIELCSISTEDQKEIVNIIKKSEAILKN
jgi:hypothetical protein